MYAAMFKHPLVTVLCLATIASAGSLVDSTTSLLHILKSRQNIYKRQSAVIPLSAFPQQCQSGCALAINALNTCKDDKCICTAAVKNSLQGCLVCSVTAVPTADAEKSALGVQTAYNGQCASAGQSISLSLPTSSTSATSGTSSQSVSVTTSSASSGSTSSSVVPTTSASAPGVVPVSTPSSTSASVPQLTTSGASTASTPTTTSAGIATASANVGYLSFTVLVTLLAALVA